MMMISLDKFHFTAATNTGKKASTAEATKNLTALLADKKNFKKIDTNGDGILTAPELEKFKQKLADVESNGLSEFAGFEKAFERLQAQQGNLCVAVRSTEKLTRFGISLADIKKIDNDFRYEKRSEDTGFNVLAGVYANATAKAENLTVDDSNPLDTVVTAFLNGLQDAAAAEDVVPTEETNKTTKANKKVEAEKNSGLGGIFKTVLGFIGIKL